MYSARPCLRSACRRSLVRPLSAVGHSHTPHVGIGQRLLLAVLYRGPTTSTSNVPSIVEGQGLGATIGPGFPVGR
jgi:hypothetical protein